MGRIQDLWDLRLTKVPKVLGPRPRQSEVNPMGMSQVASAVSEQATGLGGFVTLQGGLVVPLESVLLVLELEERGFHLEREGQNTLIVRPCSRLSEDDCRRIRRWKRHVLVLVDYC